ncbi:hypothetical protein CWT12_11280 [Actinomyces sp. 432]|uniref:hypothetical protein n=1 Tax=Actinomyces sp. 432 TaxID=2057798 RepID=UPI00137388FB|nr:hypothetical protein [Actinomyces sp. 432]QHO91770.1 hypothetical protein CWT12_11280 [Actinomyces sp. 432]
MQLVMIETNGNQNYIFSSPRLRENIGASAQLVRLKAWTDKALRETHVRQAWAESHEPKKQARPKPSPPRDATSPSHFSSLWVSRASGKVIFMVDTPQQAKAVIGHVTRTALAQAPGIDISGVFIDMGEATHVDEALLRTLHSEASRYALERLPAGSRFSQVPFLARARDSALPAAPPLNTFLPNGLADEAKQDLITAYSLPSRVKRYEAYRARKALIERAVGTKPGLEEDRDEGRLVRDPTQLENKYKELQEQLKHDLMQTFLIDEDEDTVPDDSTDDVDTDTAADNADYSLRAIEEVFQDTEVVDREIEPDDLVNITKLSKVAVIHIDGNGIGAIMRNLEIAKSCVGVKEFESSVGCHPDDPDAVRRFILGVSTRLDGVVTSAFADAWFDVARWAQRDKRAQQLDFTVVPVVPVILGGDDVTVITSGDYAIPFTTSFLKHFEEKTASDPLLKYLHGVDRGAAPGDDQPEYTPGPMTAAAGVAVVRRNFPFHIAYDLAERLVESAKRVGKAQVPAISTLTYHVLFDTTVLDADEVLSAYKSFTTRPFLLNPDPARPAGTSAAQHPDWVEVCERVNKFNGLTEEDEKSGETRFPRTRATRIRRFLSDAAQAQLRGETILRDELKKRAEEEWSSAKQALGKHVEAIGGTNGLFDLLELSDLLPKRYLAEQLGETSSRAPESASQQSEEAQA